MLNMLKCKNAMQTTEKNNSKDAKKVSETHNTRQSETNNKNSLRENFCSAQ